MSASATSSALRRQGGARQGRKLADAVYDSLREDILSRRYKPGERLSIPTLAQRFDTSQMPVRQAITRLANSGLVDVKPRSGSYVARLDLKELSDTFDVRCALERLAAESAVENVKEADLTRLGALVEAIDAAVADGDAKRHDMLNSELHDGLIRLSHNDKLVEVYEELNTHIKIARIHSETRSWAQRTELERAEHREILEALRSRDPERLAGALIQHIERSKADLLEDLRKSI